MQHKVFKTSDIILAACLRVYQYNMVSIEISGSKGTFVFSDVEEELLSKYDLGILRVEPVSFNHTIKQLTTSVRRMINAQTG